MARAATTTDVFNAIAEPRRREIIDILNDGQEWTVGNVVARVKIAQPAVSKHLGAVDLRLKRRSESIFLIRFPDRFS
jgi:DNA-binding transcriptional ArsR family regulator